MLEFKSGTIIVQAPPLPLDVNAPCIARVKEKKAVVSDIAGNPPGKSVKMAKPAVRLILKRAAFISCARYSAGERYLAR